MLRGVRPFFSDKFDMTKHPGYQYTADADKKYLFDRTVHETQTGHREAGRAFRDVRIERKRTGTRQQQFYKTKGKMIYGFLQQCY